MSKQCDWPIDSLGQAVTPQILLQYYANGCFPMGDHRDDRISWYQPSHRAIITWEHFKVPRSLRKWSRTRGYEIKHNQAFSQVVSACAERDQTWICHDIQRMYEHLFRLGVAHSIEAWQEGQLVGGCYGLTLGGLFCGESMFHRAPNASKACVWHLINHLQSQGFLINHLQSQGFLALDCSSNKGTINNPHCIICCRSRALSAPSVII